MILIEESLIYLAIPKTGTKSVKSAIIDSGLTYREFYPKKAFTADHYHVSLSEMYSRWGIKESFCVERDWFERWYSGFTYLMSGYLTFPHLSPKFSIEEVTNDFIYRNFDSQFVNSVYSPIVEEFTQIQGRFIDNIEDLEHPSRIKVLCSSNFWKSGKKCTYEFDINKMDTLEIFFKEKFNTSISIPKLNQTKDFFSFPNLYINDELKSFVYNSFIANRQNSLI